MADTKKLEKAAIDGSKKLRSDTKALSGQIDDLIGLAEDGHKAVAKLQTAADAIKPPPAKGTKLKDIKDLQAALVKAQASANFDRYQSGCEDLQNSLSPRGRQRAMLANLVSWTTTCVEQHTGGKAGESNNRRSTREVFQALKGLKAGEGKFQDAEKASKGLGSKSAALTDKTLISDLKSLSKDTVSETQRLKDVKKHIEDFDTSFSGASGALLQAFSSPDDSEAA